MSNEASEQFRCARRNESALGLRDGADRWIVRDGYRHCSYCGSLHPADLFIAIDAGGEVGPTDKSYKIYIDAPDARQGELKVVGMTNSPPAEGDMRWIKVTEENLHEILADGWSASNLGSWMMKTPRGAMQHEKFYFQHFSQEDIDRFIGLYNAKKINMGYPGHFYVTPYFAARAEASEVKAEG